MYIIKLIIKVQKRINYHTSTKVLIISLYKRLFLKLVHKQDYSTSTKKC